MPTKVLSMDSPYIRLFGATPNYTKLRVFGCLCYPWLRPYTTNKLEPRSTPCVFLGYSLTQSAYLCFNPSTSRMFVSRHVQFVENQFPFLSLIAPQPSTVDNHEPAWVPSVEPTHYRHEAEQALVPASTAADQSPEPIVEEEEDHTTTTQQQDPQPAQHQMVTRSRNNIVKPNPRYCLSVSLEPHTIQQALADEKWRKSSCAEFNAAIQNHTLDLVPAEEATN